MSRILRRPMFRGGPVNSRGTGITTGLTDKPKRGLVDEPGGYSGEYDIFSKTYQPKDYREKQQFYKQYKPLYPTIGSIENAYQKAQDDEQTNIDAMEFEQLFLGPNKRYDELNDLVSEGGKAEFFQGKRQEELKNIEDAKNYGVTITTDLEEQLQDQLSKPNPNQVRVATELDEKDILEADQKKFAKMLGKKKARIQDASNMALGFAGRAFEDEATTKSALGKFFADEAKRPSEAAKVDQAAASLAINKYIKGEISKQEMEKLIAVNSMKTNLGDGYYIAESIQKGGGSFVNGVIDGIQKNPARKGKVPVFEKVLSKDMKENFKPGPEDIGKIFIETDTQRVYEFDNNLQPVMIYSR